MRKFTILIAFLIALPLVAQPLSGVASAADNLAEEPSTQEEIAQLRKLYNAI